MRTLVIGDIHGGLRALHQIMERANVTPNDTLIFLGDYVDGWSQSPQVIDYLIELKTTHNCICILGNHDELVLEWLEKSKENLTWYNRWRRSNGFGLFESGQKNHQKTHRIPENLEKFSYRRTKSVAFIHAGFRI